MTVLAVLFVGLVTIVGLSMVIHVECPACEGGRIVHMSLGPIPCHACNDQKRASILRILYYQIRDRFFW